MFNNVSIWQSGPQATTYGLVLRLHTEELIGSLNTPPFAKCS